MTGKNQFHFNAQYSRQYHMSPQGAAHLVFVLVSYCPGALQTR